MREHERHREFVSATKYPWTSSSGRSDNWADPQHASPSRSVNHCVIVLTTSSKQNWRRALSRVEEECTTVGTIRRSWELEGADLGNGRGRRGACGVAQKSQNCRSHFYVHSHFSATPLFPSCPPLWGLLTLLLFLFPLCCIIIDGHKEHTVNRSGQKD